MNRLKTLTSGMVVGTLMSTAACGLVAAGPPKIPTSATPKNGMVASYHRLDPPGLPADVRMYRIHYWSRGVQVEALLTEPRKAGRYPLLVNLHGGGPLPTAHWNFGYTAFDAASLASPAVVELYPEYQGYLGSPGPTGGIRTDFINIQQAVTIAGEFGAVAPRDTYLLGYSLGGALALMTAGWDHQVRAVAAVSPSVGLADQVAYMQSHPHVTGPAIDPNKFRLIANLYGPNIHSAAYRERSPEPQKIDAPVLLLQGTGDPNVVWQTVQMFARQMKRAHKTVKFILYPGGQHGLHGPYANTSRQAIEHWFKRYGLTVRL